MGGLDAGAMNQPGISIIVATKNRPGDLARLFESLARQSVFPLEVIVIDQSEGAESGAAVQIGYESFPPSMRRSTQLQYIRDTSILGAAVARNRGMKLAQGSIWLFLDDDVILEEDFMKQMVAAFERHPEASGISGVVTNYKPPSLGFRLWSLVFVRGPFRDDRQPVYWNANLGRQKQDAQVSRLGAGLMAFRAEAICHHCFDENLRGVSEGEDVDLCMRLGPAARLFITPRARLVHNSSPTGRLQDHWSRRLARGLHFLYLVHWKQGLRNRLCFAWFYVGLGLVATLASVRRLSLSPWKALSLGMGEGKQAATGMH